MSVPRRKSMFKPYKVMLASLVLLSLVFTITAQVRAQGGPIEAEILPSQGSANTVILIRFNTINASVGGVQKADIFWDNYSIALNEDGLLGADGSYNYNLTVPSQPPLSNIGNHTIRVDSSVFNYGQVSFSFNFTITEFIPSPEYLTLNATYYSLLLNFTNLLNSYDALLVNYTTLANNNNDLLNNHTILLSNYNSLAANYNSLLADYNALTSNYNNLHSVSSSLQTNYASLQQSFQSLSSNYGALRTDYDSLNSNYSSLRSSYDSVLGQLAFDRNLNYVLIASTIILAITTFFFATRRPKFPSRTRN
jgi:hypothetical protein